MPLNVLITGGYFNLGFPSPPPALPPPPSRSRNKTDGTQKRRLPAGPPTRTQGSRVSIIFRVEQEQPGHHQLRRFGNVPRRKKAGDPAGVSCPLQVGSHLAVAAPVSECVGVPLSSALSVLCDCCLCPGVYRPACGARPGRLGRGRGMAASARTVCRPSGTLGSRPDLCLPHPSTPPP